MVSMQPDPHAEAVAARVRAVLGELNISGAELARRVGVTQSYMARRLLGRYPFTATDLMNIAEEIGVPATRFLPDEVAA
jgi:transcriptional regulator with XRE-family HTH domain